MVKAYFAHPVTDYDTDFEMIAIETLIEISGFAIVNPNQPEHDVGYKLYGMDYFKDVVLRSDVLIFTTFPNGKIGAGVAKEIEWAMLAGMPVYGYDRVNHKVSDNLCDLSNYAIMSVDDTRAYIKFLKNQPTTNPKILKFSYKNWEGEFAFRTVEPISMWYGTSTWHKKDGDQWFMKGIDQENQQERDFNLKDIRDDYFYTVFK